MIVEDVPETAEWLRSLLTQALPGVVVDSCGSCQSVLALVKPGICFNLVLLDINLPDGSGLELIQPILEASPDAYVVMSTIFDDEDHILTALKYGAKGYLLKDSPDRIFIQKLRGILTGDPPLSPGIARKILHHFNQGYLVAQASRPDAPSFNGEVSICPSALSAREGDVLLLIAKGYSRKEVAKVLGLSVNTVARYIRDIYQKLGISNQAEAAVEACRMGLVGVGM